MIERPARAVVDTNILVSAAIRLRSIPSQTVKKALRSGRILRSVDTWQELEDVLMREKFDRYQSIEERRRYFEYLGDVVEDVSVLSKVSECRHPNDDKFLELAIDGHAEVIITGDNDLLTLHPFRGIAILSPAEYLTR